MADSQPTSPEEWRAIPEYEGLYEVSSHGRVRSLPRVVQRGKSALPIKERILKPHTNRNGYKQINLSKAGRTRSREVHPLVMLAFAGPYPENCEIRHLDGNPGNNNLSNLRYGTKTENTMDSIRHGTHNHASRTACTRGHPLAGPNLKTYGKMRQCRACANARSAIYPKRISEVNFDEIANYYYQNIMKEAA